MLKMVAGGAWVNVAVVEEEGAEPKIIGLAQNCGYDENWGLQQANVLGHLGPISIDSQSYSCSITLGAFVPEKEEVLYADGGEITVEDLLPYRDDVQADGKSRQFRQLLFQNIATGSVIRSFSGVMVDSNGEQITANAYVTANIRFLAMKRDRRIPASA